MAARLLAFVAAVAMVVGAIAVRNGMDDEGDSPSRDGGGSGRLELVCSTELDQVCEAIGAAHDDVNVTTEPVSATLERLGGEEAVSGVDAWFTAGPWSEALAAARGDEPFAAAVSVARTPIVVAAWKPSAAACPELALACVADNLAVGTPADDTAAGILVDAAFAGAHIGNAAYATNDLAGEPEGWLTALDQKTDAVRRNQVRSVADVFTRRGASAAAFVDLETAAGIVAASVAESSRPNVTVVRAGPVVDALVAARRGSDAGRKLVEIVKDDRTKQALRSAGWRVQGGAPIAGIDPRPLPDDDGLPSPGVLHAVRDLVR